MTTIPDPDDPDTEGKTVPPYDDRKETAEPAKEPRATTRPRLEPPPPRHRTTS